MANNIFTLDSFREEVEKEFAPLNISLKDGTEITLRNLLRLPKKDRERVLALFDKMNKDNPEDADSEDVSSMLELVGELIPIVADSPAKGRKLVSEIGDDLALTMKVLEAWMGNTQPGEAASSPA